MPANLPAAVFSYHLLFQPLLEKHEDMVTGEGELRWIFAPGRVHVGTVRCPWSRETIPI